MAKPDIPCFSAACAAWAAAAFKKSLGAAPHAWLACSLLAGCAGSGAFPQPTAKHVEYSERGGYPSTLPSLKNGRRLFVNRCSGCHDLHRPAEYPPGDWPRIMLDMQENAELNEIQLVDITRYVVAVSVAAREAAAPPPTGDPAAPAAPDVPAAESGGIAP